MLSTMFLVLKLTLFVDQCDAGQCAVYGGLSDEDDQGPVMVKASMLPSCAAEGLLVNVASGTCLVPRDEPTVRNDNGADFSL